MITSMHAVVYATDADAARTFFRDVLRLPYVDAHDGWLMFKLPPAELGVHPEENPSGAHEIYLMCDDIEATMTELAGRGAEFIRPVTQAAFGLVTGIRIPGGGEIGLYQPRHETAYNL
jgi:predicted enzyme related to lactoylglutathione lyase